VRDDPVPTTRGWLLCHYDPFLREPGEAMPQPGIREYH